MQTPQSHQPSPAAPSGARAQATQPKPPKRTKSFIALEKLSLHIVTSAEAARAHNAQDGGGLNYAYLCGCLSVLLAELARDLDSRPGEALIRAAFEKAFNHVVPA